MMIDKDHHPFVVRISYKTGSPYHTFFDSRDEAQWFMGALRDEMNYTKNRVYSWVRWNPDRSKNEILISIEGILEVRVIEKSPETSDVTWLG